MLGAHNPATPTNHFAYRFLIPSCELAADPETAHFLEGDDGRMKFFIGEGKRIVWYPCRKYVGFNPTRFYGNSLDGKLIGCSNEMQNFVCIFHDDEKIFVEGITFRNSQFQRASS